MKKFLAVLLSLVMVLSLFGPAAVALEEDAAPVEPAEAVVEAAEEKLELPEIEETVTDEEPAAEEPAAEEAAEEDAEAAAPEAPAEAEEPEAEEPAEEPAEEEAEAELPEETPAEVAAPAEEVAIEEEETAEEPAEEPAPVVIPTKFEKELDNVTVTAETKAGAFSVPVELQVKPLARTSDEYKEADEALAEEGYAYDGMLAFDIGFIDADGNPVEPDGDVSVSLKLKTGGIVPENAESALVAHITEDGVEPVADTAEVAPGVVTLEVNALSADFIVDSFSTFVITWTEGEQEMKATVHWGVLEEDGSFTEFDAAVLDTTAASVSLRNSFDGYSYQSAVYCAPGTAIADGVDIHSDLYKTDGIWEYETEAGEDTSSARHPLENGSDIYAFYYVPGSPNPSSSDATDPDSIPAPTTTKHVEDNGDGTYTIVLDVEGQTVEENNSHYANVLIILDATRSMSMNGSQKWANAKAAVQTLIDTLTAGDNAQNSGKIDFCLVTFGRAATRRDWTNNES